MEKVNGLEGLTQEYKGIIDNGYSKLTDKINNVSNKYLRGFAKGMIAYSFSFSAFLEDGINKKKGKRDYSLIYKLFTQDTNCDLIAENTEVFSSLVGVLTTTFSLFYLGEAAFFIALGAGTILDTANFLEQKIRKQKIRS